MNKVVLSGNICKDIELKYTTSNIAVIMNIIAVRNDYKNKEGKYDSQFINFIAYRNNAEYLNKYATKGSKILQEGKWKNRKYKRQDGSTVYLNEVIVERIELLSSVKSTEFSEKNTEKSAEELQRSTEDPFKEFGEEITINDSDLPF